MNIELTPITDGYFPPSEGKYLVKTKSNKPIKGINSIRYVEARVTLTAKGFSIDVNNQIPTHISKQPLTY